MTTTLPKKLILVEDDPLLGSLYLHLLQQTGAEVRWLTTGQELLDRLVTDVSNDEVILLDLLLPDCSGVALVRQLTPAQRAQVIILSNLDCPGTRAQLRQMGVQRLMIKSDHQPASFLAALAELAAVPPGIPNSAP